MWLPARRRGFGTVWPGILATMVLWLICGFAFGHYLAEFAYTYVNYYAGLASAMIALVFLYYSSWIFVYGGELNAAIARVRRRRSSRHCKLTPAVLVPLHKLRGGLAWPWPCSHTACHTYQWRRGSG
jgi:uncharacterized BrkB/YihY/UPF0761 family membrane protein